MQIYIYISISIDIIKWSYYIPPIAMSNFEVSFPHNQRWKEKNTHGVCVCIKMKGLQDLLGNGYCD